MTQTEALFIDILSSFVNGTAPSLSNGSIAELVLLSSKHKVLPIVFSVLRRFGCGFEPQNIAPIKAAVMTESALGIQREAAFLKLYAELEKISVSPIVVKGAVLSRLYPEKNCRFSTDEDLLFTKEQLKKALPVFNAHGLARTHADDEDTVHGFRNSANGLYIEAHTKLFPEYPSLNIIMNELFEDAFENSSTADINGTAVKTLSPTEHLLFLILHSFKHFIYCGFGVRQILDFIVFSKSYRGKTDTSRILNSLRSVNAMGFFDALLCICQKHFNSSPDELGFDGYCPEVFDTDDLMADILSGGAYGNSSKERIHSSVITLSASDSKGSTNVLTSLFPPADILKSSYPYLRKKPYLLPIAWCSRVIAHFSKEKKERRFKATESIEIGKERLRMMKKYKIIR